VKPATFEAKAGNVRIAKIEILAAKSQRGFPFSEARTTRQVVKVGGWLSTLIPTFQLADS
jgi:hypothetical protein